LAAEQFQAAFLSWVQAVSEGQVVAIDGKQLRRSHDQQLGKAAIDGVSAWATTNHLMLAQRTVDDKSNAITAIPERLKALALHGCIVTIDALGCQKALAQTILDQHADDGLALKENQEQRYPATVDLFRPTEQTPAHRLTTDDAQPFDKGHERFEISECWTSTDPHAFP
jgi:hypothetical protein